MEKSLLIRSVVVGFVSGIALYGIFVPEIINADLNNFANTLSPTALIKNGHLTICKLDKSAFEVVKKVQMVVTAYSSTPEQTDSTPLITASGKHVEDGIIANNMFPFGTKIRIPELYGDKIFTVEDRMNKRYTYKIDIWFPEREQAMDFGNKKVKIEIVAKL